LKSFDDPDEVRRFARGRFELVRLDDMTIGRATYEPGWRWSRDVGAALKQTHCSIAHVGLVVAGHATAAMLDGTVHDLTPGTLFHIPAAPHDSWVVGEETYVSLHFMGATEYARHE